MKFTKIFVYLFFAIFSLTIVSCSKDDDELDGKKDENLVVKDDGTINGNHSFSEVDDKNFYIDYIKYSVVDAHLEVTGYDKTCFSGKAKIASSINFRGTVYQVASIGECAFKDCSTLTSVEIPNSVKSIGSEAFYKCSGLTSVTIPNSVTSIGEYAFYHCSGLTSVTIGNSVTSIGYEAFRDCSNVDELIYAEGCTTTLVTGLTSIKRVTIPNSVTSIGSYVFSRCSSLTSISVGSENQVYDSRDNCNAIIETSTNKLITGCKNTVIPNSVTSIGDDAFGECSGLTSIDIPNSVKSIGNYAFRECSGLTSVTIGNSVTSIGDYAFWGCSSLTSVTIPNSVKSIGDYAFEGCSGLTSVTIGNSVTSIGKSAFYNCSGLTSVEIPNSVKSIGYDAFAYCSGLKDVTVEWMEPLYVSGYIFYNSNIKNSTLHVPTGTAEKYRRADVWKDFGNIVEY